MASEQSFVARPIEELFGRHPGYGIAGDGVQTAIGNYTRTAVDLPMPDSLISWRRTYNSRDETVGVIGRGWTAAHTAHLEVTSEEEVAFHDTSGRVLKFVRDDSGGYRRPQDLDADLVRADDGSFTLSFFSDESWRFDPTGRLLVQTDEGRRVDLDYDVSGRLVAVEHSAGYRLDLSYRRNRLTRVVADDGRAVAYHYENAALVSVDGPDAATTRYEADPQGLLQRVEDADGVALVVNAYDAAGRVIHQDLAGVGAIDLDYDAEARRTTVTAGKTATYVFHHDDSGRITGLDDPLGNSTSLSYGPDGRFATATTPRGVRIEHGYDDAGNLVSRSVGGANWVLAYDDVRRLTRSTDPTGAVTSFAYAGASHIPTTITDPSGAVSRQEVRDGLIVSRRDPEGGTEHYDYDDRRHLAAVTDATGLRTRFSHDAAGRLVETRTPSGDTSHHVYDDAGRPLETTDRAGATTRYRYSAAGRLVEVTDPDGSVSTNSYDPTGRLVKTTDRLGASTEYTYDELGRATFVTFPEGEDASFEYDDLDRVVSASDPGGTRRYAYDADGNLVSEEGPEGTTTTEWDERGNQIVVTEPDGATRRYDYDPTDRIVKETDPLGAVWRTDYDDATRTVTSTDPNGARSTHEYTPSGRRTLVVDPLGRRTPYRYDRAHRLVEIIDPEGGHTRFAYDSDGRRISLTTPAGLVTRYRYEHGRLAAMTNPRGWITRYRYNRRGKKTEIIRPSGARTRFDYDEGGRLVSIVDPRGGVTQFDYDSVGKLTSTTDANGGVTRYRHDAAGQRIATTDPLGRTTRREYDEAGNLAAIIEPSGRTIRMEHDPAGRVVRRVGQLREGDDKVVVRFRYDKAGRRTSMSDQTGTTRYSYDDAGRLVTVTDPDDSELTAEYDAAGQRTALRYPDGAKVHYDYNLNGDLVRVRDPEAGEVVYAVDPDGRLITEQLPHRWERRYDYDDGLLSRYREIRSGRLATHTRLTRDPDGRITRLSNGPEETEVWRFAYDTAGQLISAERRTADDPDHPADEMHVSYDIVGNRTALVRGGVASRYLYDVADQLVAIESDRRRIDYDYDSAGRLTEEDDGDIRHVIAYDAFGQPHETTRSRAWATERTRVTRTGDGLPVELELRTGDDSAPPTTVRYTWSVGDEVPEVLSQTVDTEVPQADDTAPIGRDLASARFGYGHGRVFATSDHGSVNFARDALGSTVRTEQTRPWAQADGFDPFGLVDDIEPDRAPFLAAEIPRFGYRGELAYGSLLDLRARTYDAATGRFTTRDPVRAFGESGLAANPYTYADNDPLDRVDPHGTWAIPDVVNGLLLPMVPTVGSCLGRRSECEMRIDSIGPHCKTFQGNGCLHTRGSLPQDALDGDREAMKQLWLRGRREAAAHALTIDTLKERQMGYLERAKDDIGFFTMSYDIDWEVGARDNLNVGFRVDIVVSPRDIYEVKQYWGHATTVQVTGQLVGYRLEALKWGGIQWFEGNELRDWADYLDVTTGPFSAFDPTRDVVFVWGLGNPAGHVYFAKQRFAARGSGRKAVEEAEEKRFMDRSFGEDEPIIPGVRLPFRLPLRLPLRVPLPAL